jgi:putative phosphoribosyl transferase
MAYEPKFKNRKEAGRELAQHLEEFAGRKDVVVLALPRGGVPVGYEVAKYLGAPLDVFIVRKLGVPGQEELAFGALASGGVAVFNDGILRALRMPEELLQAVMVSEQKELERREQLYREGRGPLNMKDKSVVVVDDGLATGATMAAAVEALKQMGPKEIVVAVPVSSERACDEFRAHTNARCISAATPEPFYGVGMWYENFSQTTDEEVQELLAKRNESIKAKAHSS